MPSIKQATDELHKAFRYLNDTFFDGQLPEPAITIQTGGNRLTMGWCSTREIWQDSQGLVKKYEINIAAEYLNIEFYETMDTLLHEMVHLYCKVKGIKDTSRGGSYHNKRFKEECLRRGFYYKSDEPDPKIGWAFPMIKEDTKRIIDTFSIDRRVFSIARATFGRLITAEVTDTDQEESGESVRQGKKSTHIIKWVCPNCNVPVRSSKEVNIICGDCNEPFIKA